MCDTKNTLFTIGQFASLHGINKKTLMWYDETGIFKPAAIRENGYRCYTYHQSSELETILMLRELNVSIQEIRSFLENRSMCSLEQLLQEKISELDTTIAHLGKIRKVLTDHKNELSVLLNTDLSEIRIIEKKGDYLSLIGTSRDTSFDKEVEMVISESKKHALRRLHDAVYGAVIPTVSLYNGDFENYTALFMNLPNSKTKKGFYRQPDGRYLLAFCQGTWDRLPARYREILDYANSHGLVLYDYSYETGVNEMAVNSMEEYITRIEIPIKPK